MKRFSWSSRAALMLAAFLVSGLVAVPAASALPANCSQTASTVTCTFSYTGGAQTWTVPDGVTSATFDVQGAQGGSITGYTSASGGLGGRATADLSLNAGASITLDVGGRGGSTTCPGSAGVGGFNGGAAGGGPPAYGCGGAGGGGASDVRIGGSTLTARVLVAGGGGGAAAAWNVSCGATDGGAGGGLTGGSGTSITNTCIGGSGGNQTGTTGSGLLGDGSVGATGQMMGTAAGGGGGGGYYGGAGGDADNNVGGGGGGSSFGPAATTFQTGVHSSNGVITVSYTAVPDASVLAATLVADSTGAGPGTALLDKATAIQTAVNSQNTAGACAGITSYLSLVNAQASKKKLSQTQASLLKADAMALANALGC